MTYFNEFHRITTEKCLQEIAASKSLKLDSATEVQRMQQMHREIAERYPEEATYINQPKY